MARTDQTTEAASGGYTVLARRYRSRNFDEIVGQEPIARTLRNAVATSRVGHAYLFCGSRGVGKTSMARILARAINATPDLTQAAEVGDAILRGSDLDVIEIDGASNRGIDEARSLIAAAGLSPARCPYKIYIIDEVHMLTMHAFNALLKTMEEPPRHVKFILCTTEPEKVPATIRSRCQRFDFRLLSAAEIAGQLRHILKQEKIDADEHVVNQVARLARGSMRDALSLLDRLLAAGEDKLTVPLMEQMLGLPDHALASQLVDAIASGDAAGGLRIGEAFLHGGATVDQALDVIMDHLRDLMLLCACGPECDFLELPPEARRAAAAQAQRFDAAGLVHLIAICEAAARSAGGSAVARAIFDAAIVRMCHSEQFADITALLDGAGGATPVPKKKAADLAGAAPPRSDVEIVVEPKSAGDAGAALWAAVCRAAAGSANEQALVEHLAYRGFDGRVLRLAITTGHEGLAHWLSSQGAALAELAKRAAARQVEVVIEGAATRSGASSSGAKIRAAEELPLVRSAMEIFDATIVDVQEEASETEAQEDV